MADAMPGGRSFRVGIFGTFDVENYGDLLFPLIAQARLAPAGVELVAVSPTDARPGYRDALPALSMAAFAADPAQVDAVLIGGGNIVHLRDFGLPGYGASAYPALWAGATALAVRHGLPIIWNAPGVLSPKGAGPPPDWLQRVVSAADRFAVRDDESAEDMLRWSGRRPLVMPDTALDLPRLWPAAGLQDRLAEIRAELGLPESGPLVALHVKERSLAGAAIDVFGARLAAALRRCGARAILLAIGRCHGDHHVAQAIQRAAPGVTAAFDAAPSLRDIAAVIAGADAYLGASLHGHITAAAYGVGSRLVAVPKLIKFQGQARQMGRVDEVVADWSTALAQLPQVLGQPSKRLPETVVQQLDAHWQDVTRILGQARQGRPRPAIFAGSDLDSALATAIGAANDSPLPGGRVQAPRPLVQGIREGRDMTSAAETAWNRDQVEQLIAGGDLEAADRRIASVLEQSPHHLPARLAQVRLQAAGPDPSSAADLGAVLSKDHPTNPWVWRCHLQALARAKKTEQAVALFLDGTDRVRPDEAMLLAALNEIFATSTLHQQLAMLKAARAICPDNASLQLRLAMRAGASGDYTLANEMLARFERSGAALPAYAARLKSQLLAFSGTVETAADALEDQVRNGVEDAETLCRLCRFAAAAGRLDRAEAVLRRALELYPENWRVLYRLNRTFLTAAEDAGLFQRLRSLQATMAPSPTWTLQLALFALRVGQEQAGRDLLTAILKDHATGATAASLLAALDVLGPAAPRPPVGADAHVRIVRRPGARGTILVFGGFLGGLSYIPDRHLDGLLAKVPANVVYLRDPHGQVFFRGIPGLWQDDAAMQAGLAQLVAELGGGTVVTMGGSAAGYAALRAGLAIGAQQTLSFAGFVTLSTPPADEAAHSRQGMEELMTGAADAPDLRPLLLARPGYRFVQIIGDGYGPDLARAKLLDGIPQAQVIRLTGIDTHHVALPAITDGTMQRLLEAAFGG